MEYLGPLEVPQVQGSIQTAKIESVFKQTYLVVMETLKHELKNFRHLV